MVRYRNQAAFLRKVTMQLRGIKKREEWLIYFAVACLCLVISLLLLIDVAYTPAAKYSMVQGQPHITLHTGVDVAAVAARREPPPESAKADASVAVDNAAKARPAASEPENKAVKESGEWYFDETHQDWRYKKSE